MRRLAVIPSDPIKAYLDAGLGETWLREYYNPGKIFDEVYLLSPLEENNPDLAGMRVIKTKGRQLRKRLRRLHIDVVRAYGGFWACDMACNNKISGVPVVVSVHDTNPEKLHDSIKRADIVFSVSNIVNELVLAKFNNRENAWILPNRINFDEMRPYSREETVDLDRLYPFKHRIIHIGRKTRQKNLDTLIRSLRILGKDYCLIAAGRGRADEFAGLAKDSGVSGRCFFIESINNKELARYYSWADCMCNPSRWEGFGIIFIEALACAGVIVTSDIAPMNEYIRHMFNGLLVRDYEDPQALARMIRIACDDEKIRQALRFNSRASVEKFEKSRIDTLESGYYKRILNMKENNAFVTPVHKKIAWRINESVKNLAMSVMKG
ncbi:MAG: glycosyltransferase family 4 protein [Candidatus Omnitrophica bacterium]|nr:glycosyltransferase family 4 protein [Candidatus Omnitrophota bacterium]MDD5553455.1 glycosyltransferase family 4 protein [Candidatus Omnitrophota bacterium]